MLVSVRSKVSLIHGLISYMIFKFPMPHSTFTKLLRKTGPPLPKTPQMTVLSAELKEQFKTSLYLRRANYFQFVQKIH